MGWQGLEVPLAGTRTAVHHKISQKKPRKTNYDFSRIFLINQNEVFFFYTNRKSDWFKNSRKF